MVPTNFFEKLYPFFKLFIKNEVKWIKNNFFCKKEGKNE